MTSRASIGTILTTFILFIANVCFAEFDPKKIESTIDGYIKNRFVNATYKFCDKDEKHVWAGSSGYHTSGEKAFDDHTQQMPIASATKPFTASAILKLQEAGKLNVNDPVTKYLGKDSGLWLDGQEPKNFNQEGSEITIHHLLTHTSGLSEYFGRVKAGPEMKLAEINKGIAAYAASKPLRFTPGEKHEYINTNYILLGLIIEKASGKSLNQYFQDELFKPLGLKDTKLATLAEAAAFQELPNKTHLPNRYVVYLTEEGKPAFDLLKSKFFMSPFADGGMVSTVDDLVEWQKALHGGKVLSPESYKLMVTKHILTDKGTPFSKKYAGYGMYISDFIDGKLVYEHSGNAEAIRAECGYVVNKDFFFASLSNVMPKALNKKEDLALDVRNFTFAVLKEL